MRWCGLLKWLLMLGEGAFEVGAPGVLLVSKAGMCGLGSVLVIVADGVEEENAAVTTSVCSHRHESYLAALTFPTH